jgi:hypothetical protein
MAALQRFVPNRPGNDPKRYTAGTSRSKKPDILLQRLLH